MIYYDFKDFNKDVKSLALKIKNEFNPDALIAIARGGMTLGHSLAVALDTRNLFSLNSIHYEGMKKLDTIDVFNIPNLDKFKRALLVDDIVDTGESMVEIIRVLKEKYPKIEFKIATIFYKPRALVIPEFKIALADDWVEFFWDIEI